MTDLGNTLALWALIVSVLSTVIALAALAVAYLDWRQVGMESPWKFTPVGGGVWLLERIHRKPAAIRRFEYGQMCAGLEFSAMNAKGDPKEIFRRGDTELIRVTPADTIETVSIVYKEYGLRDRRKLRQAPPTSIYSRDTQEVGYDGYERWSTPVYPSST